METITPILEKVVAYATSKLAAATTKLIMEIITDGMYLLLEYLKGFDSKLDGYLDNVVSFTREAAAA